MMENYSIQDLLRVPNVKRWHTVPTVRSQSLAEHQWTVCMIAVKLALWMGLDDDVVAEIQSYALIHDSDEIWTGDMPSPAKEIKTNGRPSPESQEGVGMGVASVWPTPEGGTVEHPWNIISGVVRAADRMEAAWWISENGIGRYGGYATTYCWDALDKFSEEAPKYLEMAIEAVMNDIESAEFTPAASALS